MKISDIYSEILESDEVDEEDFSREESLQRDSEGLINYLKKFTESHAEDDNDITSDLSEEEIFEDALDVVEPLDYSDQDVNELCKWLEESSYDTDSDLTSSEKPHLFVSAALEALDQEEVHLTSVIGGLGYKNSKKLVLREGYDGMAPIGMDNTGEIRIKGNAETTVLNTDGKVVVEGKTYRAGYKMEGGSMHLKEGVYDRAGVKMKGGKIQIEGNVREAGFNMKDGEIVVSKDVEENAGFGMADGRIEVQGDAYQVGSRMKGGELHVEGDVEYIGKDSDRNNSISGGEIYVEGEIGEIVDEVDGAEIYQKEDGEWRRVA